MKIIILKMLIWLKIVQHIKLNKKYCEGADDSNTEQSLYRKAHSQFYNQSRKFYKYYPLKDLHLNTFIYLYSTLCTNFLVFLSHH